MTEKRKKKKLWKRIVKIVVHRCASQLPEQRPTGTANTRAEIIIYIFIMFAQEPEIPGNEIQEEWSFFKCKAISYPTTNFCQKKCESCDKCQEVKPCLEFLMFGTGPVQNLLITTIDLHVQN